MINDKHADYYAKCRKATQEELNQFLIMRCRYADFEQIKYLLSSKELSFHADIHTEKDIAFAYLIGQKEEARETIEYLIFEYGIEKTVYIEEVLTIQPNQYCSEDLKKFINECKKMFETRELAQSLNNELNFDKINNIKQTKI